LDENNRKKTGVPELTWKHKEMRLINDRVLTDRTVANRPDGLRRKHESDKIVSSPIIFNEKSVLRDFPKTPVEEK